MEPASRTRSAEVDKPNTNADEAILDNSSTGPCPETCVDARPSEAPTAKPSVVKEAEDQSPAKQIPSNLLSQTCKLLVDQKAAARQQTSPCIPQAPAHAIRPGGCNACSREDSRQATTRRWSLQPIQEEGSQEQSNKLTALCSPIEPGNTAGSGESPESLCDDSAHGSADHWLRLCGHLVEEVSRVSQRMDQVEHAVEHSPLNPGSRCEGSLQRRFDGAQHPSEGLSAIAEVLEGEREVTMCVTLRLGSGNDSGSARLRGATPRATSPVREIVSDLVSETSTHSLQPEACASALPSTSCRSKTLGPGAGRIDQGSFKLSETAAQDGSSETGTARNDARNTWETVFREISGLGRRTAVSNCNEKCLPEAKGDAVVQRMARYDDALREMGAHGNTKTDAACAVIAQLGREVLSALQEASNLPGEADAHVPSLPRKRFALAEEDEILAAVAASVAAWRDDGPAHNI